jgi:dipeptide/tripeptide permease
MDVKRETLIEQVKSFARPFWAANVMELIERFAYYGVRVVVPIYIASSEDPGGLHFTNTQKGTIFGAWAAFQTLVPLFSGGLADKYGRKSTIAVSIAVKMAGYLMMATQRTFWGFFAGCMVLATGTAVFKPGVQGTLVRGTDRGNSSVGWGIFYQIVNIGGWLGPPLAGILRGKGWSWVFYGCAAIVSLNYLVLLSYRDPVDPPESEADRSGRGGEKTMGERSALEVVWYALSNFITRPRLVGFVLIISGFWLMFMQLYDSLPNFIEEWTDSRSLVAALHLPAFLVHATSRGVQLKQEWMINLDSTLIVLFMVPIAYVASRLRRLVSMIIGIFISTAGLLLAGMTMSGALCLAGIAVFAVGEMAAAPKINEYLGVIAPKGEEALYMGYANVPVAFGWIAGSKIAGVLYDRLADKSNLARSYLLENHLLDANVVSALKREEVMAAFEKATKLDAVGATQLLWDRYHPATFWWIFVAVGIVSAVAMMGYARIARRWTTENA